MRIAIITLITVTLGTGVLTLPKAMAWFGWIPGLIALTLAALSQIYCYNLLSHVQALVS
jgi:amino acid permease